MSKKWDGIWTDEIEARLGMSLESWKALMEGHEDTPVVEGLGRQLLYYIERCIRKDEKLQRMAKR